jgi:predicted phage baseplate assembly protein
MPLDDHIPKIDDRRYDDIIAEVRTRIARYTPEWSPVWTDVNDSDPGITLAQVFAWQADMLLYRMGKVPELNYLKFLQLLGIELKPAEPALAEITFPVKEDYTAASYVIVPRRAQISAESPDGDPPLIFETDRAVVALKARLDSVQAFDGYSFNNLSETNLKALEPFDPFGTMAQEGAALLLGFFLPNKTEEFPDIDLDLAIWSTPQQGQAEALQCGFPDIPAFAPARIRWEYWNGAEWQSLKLLNDETRAFTRTGHILLKTRAKPPMKRAVIGDVTEERYWIRAVVERSQYERAPRLLAIRTNTVAARQAETIVDEVLGGSNGRRDQVFRLASLPVLLDGLRLEVDEGDAYQAWTRVDDLLASSPDDLHFVLNRTTGEIRFGDGLNGHIPVANPNNTDANIVARLYRIGGGKRGN